MEKFYYEVVSSNSSESVEQFALDECACDGIQEFTMTESSIDEILGKRAYCGGDVTEDVVSDIEKSCEENHDLKRSFFFYKEGKSENALSFCKFLEEKEIEFCLFYKKQEDWNAKWRENYDEIIVSDSLKVVPEWKSTDQSSYFENEIYIYPGMGFGTGEHETTFLCLKLMEEFLDEFKGSKSILDLGCGSGILGIGAIKKLGSDVVFCDIDKNALDNSLQNLTLNFPEKNLKGSSLVIRNRLDESIQHDLIFANILEHVLVEELDSISSMSKKGTYLILSGILITQKDGIIEKYSSEFNHIKSLDKGDWSAVLMRKK